MTNIDRAASTNIRARQALQKLASGQPAIGTATLVAGVATVTTSKARTDSLIYLSRVGNLTNAGALTLFSLSEGSFVVKSTNASDAGSFNWLIHH